MRKLTQIAIDDHPRLDHEALDRLFIESPHAQQMAPFARRR